MKEELEIYDNHISKILHDKSEKPTENGPIVCFGWNEKKKCYVINGMDYMKVVGLIHKIFSDVKSYSETIEEIWNIPTFSKWCYLADLLPEEVLDEIKNNK